MTAHQPLPLGITEAQFSDWFYDLGRLNGWMMCHYRPAKTEKGWRTALTGDPGCPDWILARKLDILLVELKTEKGKVTRDQHDWLAELGANGRLWRPSDYLEIIQELA